MISIMTSLSILNVKKQSNISQFAIQTRPRITVFQMLIINALKITFKILFLDLQKKIKFLLTNIMEQKQINENQYHGKDHNKQAHFQQRSLQNFKASIQAASEVLNDLITKVITIDDDKILHRQISSQNMQFFSDTYHIMKDIPQTMPDNGWTNDLEGQFMKCDTQERKIKFKQTVQCLRASKILNDAKDSFYKRVFRPQDQKIRAKLKSCQSQVGSPISTLFRSSQIQDNNQYFEQFPLFKKNAGSIMDQRSQQNTFRLAFKNLITSPSKRELIPLKNTFLEKSTPFEEMKRQQLKQYIQVRRRKRAEDENKPIIYSATGENFYQKKAFNQKAASTLGILGKELVQFRCNTNGSQIKIKLENLTKRQVKKDQKQTRIKSIKNSLKHKQKYGSHRQEKNSRKNKQGNNLNVGHKQQDKSSWDGKTSTNFKNPKDAQNIQLAVKSKFEQVQQTKKPFQFNQLANRIQKTGFDRLKKSNTEPNQVFNQKILEKHFQLKQIRKVNQTSVTESIQVGKKMSFKNFKAPKTHKIYLHEKGKENINIASHNQKQYKIDLKIYNKNLFSRLQTCQTSRILVFNTSQFQQLKQM